MKLKTTITEIKHFLEEFSSGFEKANELQLKIGQFILSSLTNKKEKNEDR